MQTFKCVEKNVRRPSTVFGPIPPITKLPKSPPQIKRIIYSSSENNYFTSRGRISNKWYKVDNDKCQKSTKCYRRKSLKVNQTKPLQNGEIFNATHVSDQSKFMLGQIRQYIGGDQMQNIQPTMDSVTAFSLAHSSVLGDCQEACAARRNRRIHCPITADPKIGQQCISDPPKYGLDPRKVEKCCAAAGF